MVPEEGFAPLEDFDVLDRDVLIDRFSRMEGIIYLYLTNEDIQQVLKELHFFGDMQKIRALQRGKL